MSNPENAGVKQSGRFQPGRSGNPAGKAPGTRNRALVILDKLGEDSAADVVRAVIEAAKGGDVAAARAVLDRVWPIRRGKPITLDLPPVTGAADLPNALAAVTAAMAAGEISPEEASAVAVVLEGTRKAIETSDLERRIAAIEMRKA